MAAHQNATSIAAALSQMSDEAVSYGDTHRVGLRWGTYHEFMDLMAAVLFKQLTNHLNKTKEVYSYLHKAALARSLLHFTENSQACIAALR